MTQRAVPAKISAPRLFGIIERPRLFAQIDARRECPLIWIDAPPGMGKTALVASYIADRRVPAMWYQVDASDSDPASFFHCLSEACAGACSMPVPKLPRFSPDHLPVMANFTRRFFAQLFADMPAGVVIVLDNYQEVPEDAALRTIVQTAAEQVPRGSSIFCLSRAKPGASYSVLTAQGALTRIDWNALLLTLDETRAILQARALHDEWLVQALHQQSEGWVAGITLMLERLGQVTSRAQLLPGEMRGSVFDYFATLIFNQTSEATRRILTSVAILPYVTPRAARELSGHPDAGDVLEDLYLRHLFVDKRQRDGEVYHLHALFRDFLLNHARASDSEERRRALATCGAHLLESDHDLDSAVQLWAGANSWRNVERIVTTHARAMLNSGRRATLVRWIALLPEAEQEAAPQVLYWSALCRGQTSSPEALAILARALPMFTTVEGRIDCLAALLSTGFVGFVALDEMETWLDQILVLLEEYEAGQTGERSLRVWGVLCAALFWIKPWHPWAQTAADRVETLITPDAGANDVITAAASALATCSFTGAFELADRIITHTRHLADTDEVSPTAAVWWFTHAGFLRFFEARYEESLMYVHRARDIAQINGLGSLATLIDLHRVAVEGRVQGWEVAGKTLMAIQDDLTASVHMETAMYYLLKGRYLYSQGRTVEAAEMARLGYGAGVRSGSRYQEMLFGLIAAEMILAAGGIAEVRPLIARSRAIIECAPVLDCWRAALHWIEAFLAWVEGGPAAARASVREALQMAAAGTRRHYLRHFECALRPLLNLALDEGIEVPQALQIIRLFRMKPEKGAFHSWPVPIRIHTLGRFEVLVEDRALKFQRKTPKKTLALLKALIAFGGHEVSEQHLCDTLWSDEEGDAAHEAMSITVFRLRKLLGVPDAILQQGGKVTLERSVCWVDAWCFEDCAATGDDARMQQALEYYGGEFLPEDTNDAWSVSTRERLRGKFIHLLATHGAALERQANHEKAISLYFRGIEADPVVEAFHQGLMRCYQAQQRHAEALSVFRRLRQTLSAILGLAPSAESRRLFDLSLQQVRDAASGQETTVPTSRARG